MVKPPHPRQAGTRLHRTMRRHTQALRFELSSHRLAPEEQRLFQEDLIGMNLDERVWDVLDATLATRTSASVPYLLRAFRGSELCGIALILVCRKLGRCISKSPLVAGPIDLPGLPIFVWNRVGSGIDQYTNPGYVAGGLERSAFLDQALEFLIRRYPYGLIMDHPTTALHHPSSDVPNLDYGFIDLEVATGREYFLQNSKNLKRKVRKLANKGGTIDVVRGPLPPDILQRVVQWMRELDPDVRTGFQDNYPNMVEAASQQPSAATSSLASVESSSGTRASIVPASA